MATLEAHKQVVWQYVEAFNCGDFEALRNLFTPDALIYGVLGWGAIAQALPIWQELHTALAIQLKVEEMIAEGDTVAVRYIESGTFRATWRGQAPTGKSYELGAMEWFTLREGKIQRRWGARDALAQMRQLGLPLH